MAYSSKISKILKPKVVAGRSALGHNYKTMSTTKKAMVLSAPAQFKTRFVPQIDDEWEKMYLDIDDNEQFQHIECDMEQIAGSSDKNHHDFCEATNITISSIDNGLKPDELIGMHSHGNENGSQCPHARIDDDWEKMYLNDDGTFINAERDDDQLDGDGIDFGDDNSSCCSFDPINENVLQELNEMVNGAAYLEDLDDEDEARDTSNKPAPESKLGNEETNQGLSSSDIELSGRRIVDIGYLFKQIQSAGKHSEECHWEDMVLKHEIKSGLSSIFIFKCGVCEFETRVETDQKKRTALGINRDAVLGITSVGLGFSHMEEVCANLNVPSMSYSLFRKHEKVQQEDWFKLAKQQSMKALMEEIALARAEGEVDSKGNALIRIITDGSWGKRSYGRFFSSLSGCAVIIGLRTNKVIFFDTRNKYCHTCKLAESKGDGEIAKDHKCNKNYSGPSTGMESDIIVQGFKECDVHGARFNVMISDGDSNTYKLIRDLRIYKDPDVYVAKLECVNHLYRNFYKKFNHLSSITKFNCDHRHSTISKQMCANISTGIRSATKHWCNADEPLPTKIRMLEKDILNVLPHYLGYHEQCNKYFCKKTSKPGVADHIKSLKDDGLYFEVQSILQTTFGNNAKSLLAGYTNNPAEQFNSYVAKYLGGKRINFSLAGSYTARVAMAVVHFNSDCHGGSTYREMKFGGVSDVPAVGKLESKRKRKCVQTAINRAKKPRTRRFETEQEKSGTSYGGNYAEDMDVTALEAVKNLIIEKTVRNQENRTAIENLSKNDEHLFKEKTRNMLMSYYFNKIVNSKGPKFYSKILEEVLYTQSQLGHNAQNRHQRVQEQEALKRFQEIYPKAIIEDCGLYIHEEISFLGASPFKVVGDDHILFVKCPLKLYQKQVDQVKMQFWMTKGGKKNLNKNSAWYIEVQGELQVTKRKWAYLFIWLGEDQSQHQIIEIRRDDRFFEEEMKEKLLLFYTEGMVKELADPRKDRNMDLRVWDASEKTFV